MSNVDATPTEAAPHSPPYLVISFRGRNEHTQGCGRSCCLPETLGTVEPCLVIQRAATADAAIDHIVVLDRQLRADPHSGDLCWSHIVVDQTLRTVGDDDDYLLDFVDDFTDGHTVDGDYACSVMPNSWRDRIADRTAALDAAAAAAEAERVRLAAEAAERHRQEAAERARVQAEADAAAAAVAAEARDRAEFARLRAKYGKDA